MQIFILLVVGQVMRLVVLAGAASAVQARVKPTARSKADLQRELRYSAYTIVIYSLVYALLFNPTVLPKTQIYFDARQAGLGWFVISFPLLFLIHETYFYWMHRFLHLARVFTRVHRVHHLSLRPSAWAAQSFHPFEAVIEIAWVVPLVFLMPTHLGLLIAFSFISLGTNVVGHTGVDALPESTAHYFLLKWLNTSTHHQDHHLKVRGNYGLYFRFWDRWMNTQIE